MRNTCTIASEVVVPAGETAFKTRLGTDEHAQFDIALLLIPRCNRMNVGSLFNVVVGVAGLFPCNSAVYNLGFGVVVFLVFFWGGG